MLKLLEKLAARSKDSRQAPVTVAFLGDSVTQGCFEIYQNAPEGIETEFDSEASYSADFRRIFAQLYPRVPLHIINAGISGDSASGGLERLKRDVLDFHPDLVIVCFGLNDCGQGDEGLSVYTDNMTAIFRKLGEAGVETIFMTPNMMSTYVDWRVTNPLLRTIINDCSERQNDGVLDRYVEAAKEAAQQEGVLICDCYSAWKRMAQVGVDTTGLLVNYVNHPAKAMHWMFAWMLTQTIFNA